MAPRFPNVTRLIVHPPRSSVCYSPQTGHYPCLEVPVVVLYKAADGKEWGISTSYKIDGTLVDALTSDFGPAAPVALRSVEPSIQIGMIDRDPRIRDLSEKVLPQIQQTRHYEVNPEVLLTFAVEQTVSRIADEHWRLTRRPITVTSGTRTAQSQAEAMYTKLSLGDDILALYRNQAAAQAVKTTFDVAVADGRSRDETVASMRDVIAGQVASGVYISNHLKAGAVDIRTKDMTEDEKAAFLEAAAEVSGVTVGKEETKPPHFHLDIGS